MAVTLHGGVFQIFHHNHSHENDSTKHKQVEPGNINVQAASLHILGDFIQSIGVIIAAVIIKLYVSEIFYFNVQFIILLYLLQPQAKIVDPLITFSFSIIVLCTTLKVFKKSVGILLEAVPDHVDYEKLLSELKNIEDVESVHDFKIWSLSNDFHASTVHLVIRNFKNHQKVLKEALNLLSKHVHQISIQIEVKEST